MQIYLDNAATTSVSETALQAMRPILARNMATPSSLHSFGQRANEALTEAREKIAALLHCQVREITFTSGGSEARQSGDPFRCPDRGKKWKAAHHFHRL